ncbi:MAG: ribonuclease R [Bacteroidales bacterium]|nr:ribonuclease R [Bacteroidales bacterium]
MPNNMSSKFNKNNIPNQHSAKILLQQVLNVFAGSPQKLFNYKQMAARLKVRDLLEKEEVKKVLTELLKSKNITEVYEGKYKYIMPKTYVTGKVDVSRRGYAYVLSEEAPEPVFISPRNLHNALHGDTVKIQMYASRKSKQVEGEVIQIIERARTQFAGIIERNKKYAFFMPDDLRIPYDIYIPLGNLNGAKSGEKVIVSITEWHPESKNPTGTVVKVLGKPGDNEAEINAIMVEFGLPYEFSNEMIREAEKIDGSIPVSEIKKRRDFRETLTFTIDPEDAKDFDDAISYKVLDNGSVEIGVHIADVTHYVNPATVIDTEAQERATSVYLVDRVVPMLPERLSNEICSLQPHVDKLCFSAVFILDSTAKILDEWYGKTVINSNRRFNYEEVQKIIDTGQGDLSKEIAAVNSLAHLLREQRFRKGAFNFESTEVKFNLDEKGKPLGVYFKEPKESNWLIEEFMLLANRKVAELLSKTGKVSVYRIHDEPNPEKMESFSGFIKKFGYSIETKNAVNLGKSINGLIEKVQGKPEQNVIQSLAIRSMAKAEYSTENIGHYGLAFTHYTHFTSPIRRYPDMMVHRLLENHLTQGRTGVQDNYKWLCKHSSDMEQRAVQAERASVKYKQAEYLSDKIGLPFEGVISGVTDWGFFVELVENKCEGLVHIRTLIDDFYFFDEDNFCIIGKTTGRKFTLGDTVKVAITGVNLSKKQIDMELLR